MYKSTLLHNITTLLLLSLSLSLFSQNQTPTLIDIGDVKNANEDFSTFEPLKSTLEDVEIIMLGEPTHGDGTAYESMIKLTKFLHQEMGFDLLVFESGIYDCHKAWQEIQNGKEVDVSLAKGIFGIWSLTDKFKPLAQYIDNNKNSNHPLIISGFDNQPTSKNSRKFLIQDLTTFLLKKDKSIVESETWEDFAPSLQLVLDLKRKEYKKKQAVKDTAYITSLLPQIESNDSTSQFWYQTLKSLKHYISDTYLRTNHRDRQMAENLIWIKNQNPGKKIICWGSTGHFINNSTEIKLKAFPYTLFNGYYKKTQLMGQYIKEKYASKAFNIGCITYEGTAGLFSKRRVRPAKPNSLEYLISKSDYENCFLNLNEFDASHLIARPLSYAYMENNISNNLDGVIFNRNMVRPRWNLDLYVKVYPEEKQRIEALLAKSKAKKK